MKSHYVITMTTRNRDTNPLIAVHHDREKAIREYEEMSRIVHYYYKLTEIREDRGQRIRNVIRSEYYNNEKDPGKWEDTAKLYE